jgi:fatty acid/phospholipid biosynthesis enzyme
MPEFSAVIESARGGGHYVLVPDEIASAIAAKHMMRVKGMLSGAPYRSNIAKMGGRLILGVHKATLKAAGKDTGEDVVVTIEIDAEWQK